MTKQTYLTKRILARCIRRAFKGKKKEAMELMGYVIEAQGNYIVKEWASSKIERIKKISTGKRKLKIILD
jgi:hypothetical protein